MRNELCGKAPCPQVCSTASTLSSDRSRLPQGITRNRKTEWKPIARRELSRFYRTRRKTCTKGKWGCWDSNLNHITREKRHSPHKTTQNPTQILPASMHWSRTGAYSLLTIAGESVPSSTDGWHRVPIHVFKPCKGGTGTITSNFTGLARLWCHPPLGSVGHCSRAGLRCEVCRCPLCRGSLSGQ